MNLEPEAQDKKVETATKSQRPNNLNKKLKIVFYENCISTFDILISGNEEKKRSF